MSADIAIASREAPGAIRYGEPYYRHFVGRIYNGLIRTWLYRACKILNAGSSVLRAAVARMYSRARP